MDIREIESEIKKLEQGATDYQNCSKLAVLYCISDHFKKPVEMAGYSYSKSEFINAVSSVPIEHALDVLDEHMECVKLLYPKEYSALLKKIRDIK